MRFIWLGLVLALVGCQGGLDRDKLDKEIVTTLKEKGVDDATVNCPEVAKLTEGKKFQCEGHGLGRQFKVDVSVTDDKGTVRWDLVGKIVETKKLADFVTPQIKDKVGAEIAISCPQPKAIMAPKDSITCNLTSAGEKMHVALTAADNGVDVTWEIQK